MEFGKIPESELQQIDFTLPPEPPGNKEVLKHGKGKTKFYIGCAKWGRKDWIGKLYPKGTSTAGAFHVIGERPESDGSDTVFCEGWATGVSPATSAASRTALSATSPAVESDSFMMPSIAGHCVPLGF